MLAASPFDGEGEVSAVIATGGRTFCHFTLRPQSEVRARMGLPCDEVAIVITDGKWLLDESTTQQNCARSEMSIITM